MTNKGNWDQAQKQTLKRTQKWSQNNFEQRSHKHTHTRLRMIPTCIRIGSTPSPFKHTKAHGNTTVSLILAFLNENILYYTIIRTIMTRTTLCAVHIQDFYTCIFVHRYRCHCSEQVIAPMFSSNLNTPNHIVHDSTIWVAGFIKFN